MKANVMKGLEGARPSMLLLLIGGTAYRVRVHRPAGANGAVLYRLGKADGTLYDVLRTPFGNQCDCPDFVFRREGLDPAGCKHVRALVGAGLMEADAVPGRGLRAVVST